MSGDATITVTGCDIGMGMSDGIGVVVVGSDTGVAIFTSDVAVIGFTIKALPDISPKIVQDNRHGGGHGNLMPGLYMNFSIFSITIPAHTRHKGSVPDTSISHSFLSTLPENDIENGVSDGVGVGTTS